MNGFGIIGFAGLAAMPQILLGTTAVMTVLCIELPRSLGLVDLNAHAVFVGCRHFFAYCAPEAVGLMTVFLVAVLLRLRGDFTVPSDPLAAEVWEEVKEAWPVLMGADTLLSLQSLLRLLIFTSAAFRAGAFPGFTAKKDKILPTPSGTDHSNRSLPLGVKTLANRMDPNVMSPLSGMGAVLSLGGMSTRVWLYTHAEIYRLEGPLSLGGYLPLVCDLCSVALLMTLAHRALRPSTGTPLRIIAAGAFALMVSSQHYVNLAKDSSLDSVFTLTYVLECLAAFAFACRAAINSSSEIQGSQRGRAFMGFVHVLMAFQQTLSAYYFLTALEPSPKLVGAGRPFCVLIWSNLLAFAAYLCAAGLYFGGLCAEGSDSSSTNGTQGIAGVATPSTASANPGVLVAVGPATPSISSIDL
mmetsp:Transcript_64117/g.106201  ORF Transcript_64117/g.106201 Transcript_64117/m.106201 type:complete len:413 (+) Transcript_64117:86-1324(+)